MGRRFNRSDPTANHAIGNVDRERKRGDLHYVKPPRRKLAREFPAAFAGLILHHGVAVGNRAIELAGGDVNRVEEHHLNQARAEHDRRERGDDGGDAA